jgi:hypothetical protein
MLQSNNYNARKGNMKLCPVLPLTRQAVIRATSVALLLVSSTVAANQVTLVTVSKGQMALLPASWTIFKAKDKERKTPIASLPRHTGTIDLPAGFYCAQVKAKKQTKETVFRVQSNVNEVVTISLD